MVSRYPTSVIFIHWLTLVFVLTAYISGGNPTYNGVQGQIHVVSGFALFLLFFIRLGLIFYYRKWLPKNEILNKLQVILFKTVRIFLYLCLFIVPFFGWLALSSFANDFKLFGFSVPLFTPLFENEYIGEIHQLLGNLFVTLVGLHACAALIHHFYLKDNVLKSMLFHRDNNL